MFFCWNVCPENYLGEDFFRNFDDRYFYRWVKMFFWGGGVWNDIGDGDYSSWWFSNPKQKSRAPNFMFGKIRGDHWMITLYPP